MSKEIVWFSGEIKTPPFSADARLEIGMLLRRLQDGERIGLPASRPMPSVGKRVHELRVNDETTTWRLIYRIDADAIIVLEVFAKKTNKMSKQTINTCKRRIRVYNSIQTGRRCGNGQRKESAH